MQLTKQAYTYYFTQPEADAVLAETGKRVHAVRADRLDPDCHSDLDAYKYSVDLGNFPYKVNVWRLHAQYTPCQWSPPRSRLQM